MKFSGKKSSKKGGFRPLKRKVEKSRKAIRKAERRDKKANKVKAYLKSVKRHREYFAAKNKTKRKGKIDGKDETVTTSIENNFDESADKLIASSGSSKSQTARPTDLSSENKKSRGVQKNLQKEMKKQRIRVLMKENEQEDKIISSLEKQLKLNKRKSKSLPSSFVSSGLDYILDACDTEKIKSLAETEKYLQDSGSEFEDDIALVKGQAPEKKIKKQSSQNKSDDSDSECSEDESDDATTNAPQKRCRSILHEIGSKKKRKTDDNCTGNDENLSHSDDDDDDLLADLQGDDESDEGDWSDEEIDGEFDGSDWADSMDEETQKNTFTNSRIGRKVRKINEAGIMESSSDSEPDEVPVKRRDPARKTVRLNVPGSGSESSEKPSKGGVAQNNTSASKKKCKNEKILEKESVENDEMLASDNDEDNDDTWEDIYGRTRDKQGNVVQADKGRYVPPALRAHDSTADNLKRESLERLKRQLKGLLNRLAENNMHSIATQIEQLYMANSRNDTNQCLIALFTEAIASRVHTPERLIMEHAMLTAILQANVGTEVGAYILQSFVMKFDQLLNETSEIADKRLDNLLTFICHLYTFKVFQSSLLYDVLSRLCDEFQEKQIELILVVLRSVGFTLRKDNPIALKELILKVQRLASEATSLKKDSRVSFMLDVLLKIKNNNMSKLPQYDTSHSEHLKKLLKSMVRKGNYVTQLNISLEDLLKADERGRWWIVGSAWTGAEDIHENGDSSAETSTVQQAQTLSHHMADLARKLRINTDVRKKIFSVLMTAEDYQDAFEKLLKLGLKGQMMNEIVHVILHCLLQEKQYNHYYSLIANRFCQSDRHHRMVFQYSVWDKFKEVDKMKQFQVTNLAKFLGFLFIEGSLPISVLKVIQLAEMTKSNVRLIRQILLSVLYSKDEESIIGVFQRLTKSAKLHLFREGLRLFLHHFLLKNMKETEDDYTFLKNRINSADRALTAQTY